jgi:hypothetical protein
MSAAMTLQNTAAAAVIQAEAQSTALGISVK